MLIWGVVRTLDIFSLFLENKNTSYHSVYWFSFGNILFSILFFLPEILVFFLSSNSYDLFCFYSSFDIYILFTIPCRGILFSWSHISKVLFFILHRFKRYFFSFSLSSPISDFDNLFSSLFYRSPFVSLIVLLLYNCNALYNINNCILSYQNCMWIFLLFLIIVHIWKYIYICHNIIIL